MSKADLATWDRRHRYKQKHIDAKLCRMCPNPVQPGRRHCEKHAAENRARAKQNYKKRVENGLCVYCGRPLGEDDKGYKSHNRNSCRSTRRLRA